MAEKEFNVKKFDGKSNVQEFTSQLEIEFTRHDIVEDLQKIEILRFMVTGNIIDWYEASKSKLSMHDWNAWKVSLIETYGVINYARVRSVFEFQYMGGRLVDYAIKKERLILELDPLTREENRLDWIVMGLPLNVTAKLNRTKTTSFTVLINKLAVMDEGKPRSSFQPKSEKRRRTESCRAQET